MAATACPTTTSTRSPTQNAMRWYSYDPFARAQPGAVTVAALRAEAAGHDVATHSFDTGRYERKKGADLGKLAKAATA